MLAEMTLTYSDSDSPEETHWRLFPSNTVAVTEFQLASALEFFSARTDDPIPLGRVSFVRTEYHRMIDDELHDQLLRRSLDEYGELWEKLAGM